MANYKTLGPKQKSLAINIDPTIYGTFAEIGAGQECARYFFQAGGAAGTIAKTMSAYDMVISDTIYGKEDSGRYVCEDRLLKMLSREFDLLVDRLANSRGKDTRFFSFADTVAAKSYSGKGECHGWMGVTFQHEPGADASQLILHVRMLDQENIQQQEAVGRLGVNMIYACFNYSSQPKDMVISLMDNLTNRRIEIDMIRVDGPAFNGMDSRLLSLELVKRNYTRVVMFNEDGKVISARDTLYKKNLIVARGSFRPPTHVNMDMLKCGREMFCQDLDDCEHEQIEVLSEISMSKLLERGEVSNDDFLARVDLLSALKQKVLISNFDKYSDVNLYLQQINRKKIIFVSGVYNLEEILDVQRYKEHPGGLLAAMGELFGHNTQVLIYPAQDDNDSNKLRTIANVKYDESLQFLVEHLVENEMLKDVVGYNKEYSHIWSRQVLKKIREGESGWEDMVPEEVVKRVKHKNLFK